MSSENHKIQRVLFEISSTDSENYKSDEIWFSDFFNNSLLIALEQVFEEINIDHKIITISKIELDAEQKSLKSEISALTALLKSDEALRKKVAEELREVASKYATPRRTIIA